MKNLIYDKLLTEEQCNFLIDFYIDNEKYAEKFRDVYPLGLRKGEIDFLDNKLSKISKEFNAEIDFDERHLILNKNKITFSQETNLENINWNKYGVDYVFECTGKFNSKDKLLPHLNNGAKKVIVSAPCKNADKTIVFGVNESELKKDDKSSTPKLFITSPITFECFGLEVSSDGFFRCLLQLFKIALLLGFFE